MHNLSLGSTFQTTVDITVGGTLTLTDNITWAFSGFGRNSDHSLTVSSSGTFSCGLFDYSSLNINNDLTITNEGTFSLSGNFLSNVREDCDVIFNINNRVDIAGQLRSITGDDDATSTFNVRDSLIIGSFLRMDVYTTALATNNQINMDFSNAYFSLAFMVFNGKGGSINSSALNESTIEQVGISSGTYILINDNITYHNFKATNTHSSGIYIASDTLTTSNFLGDLTVGSGSTFNIRGQSGTAKPLGIAGDIINNGTINDEGAGITVNGTITNSFVFNNDGSNLIVGGDLTNPGTFNNGDPVDKIQVTGNFSNSGTFDADVDSLVVTGNFSNTATYTSAGNDIYLDGNWSNTGTYTFVDGDTVSFEGSSAQTITGTTIFDEMIVDNAAGVSITSGSTSIKSLLKPANGTLTTNGNLTLISDATETAAVAELGGSAAVSGNVTVQRYMNEGTGWYLLASPVTGSTLADWNNELPMSGFTGSDEPANPWTSVYYYDETTRAPSNLADSGYVAATNTTQSLVPGEGWFVYFDEVKAGGTANTMDVTGPLQTGTVNLNLGHSFGLPSPGTNGGWHLQGNPYASPVDWSLVTIDAGIENSTVYVLGNGGGYLDVVNDNVDYLYSGEAFWAHVTSGAGVGNITFNENDKAVLTDDYNAKLSPSPYKFPLKMELTVASDADYSDYAVLRFGDDVNYTENFDYIDGDSRKLDNVLGGANISSYSNDTSDVYYNTLSSQEDNYTIPVRIWKRFSLNKNETFTIKFNGLEDWTTNNKCVILYDSVAKVTKKLESFDNEYVFTAMDTIRIPRIFLTYTTPLEVASSNVSCFGYNDGSATVNGDGNGIHTYTWIDDNGNEVKKDKSIIGQSTANNLAPGTYTVWVSGNGDCGTVAATITIEEPDPIIAEFSSSTDSVFLNANSTIYFTNASSNAQEYFWDFGDGNTSAQENPAHTYTTGGTYEVMMVASEAPCSDTLFKTVVVIDNVGIDEDLNGNEGIQIYQLSNETFVEFNLPTSKSATIMMHDVVGRSIIDPITVRNAKDQKVKLNVPQETFGIYTISVLTENDKFSKKLYYSQQ